MSDNKNPLENEENINIDQDKINKEKEYQKLVGELNKANNLVDYFLVIGVPPEILVQNWLYQSTIDELNSKYKKELEPKIISSFPPITKETISFDESIINHCFPNGYELIKSDDQPQQKLFSFILDNNYYNLNYPKKYLSCLIFYEKITQYKILYDEYIKLSSELGEQNIENQLNLDKNDSLEHDLSSTPISIPISSSSFIPTRSSTSCTRASQNIKDDNIYIPKCLVVMSLYPFFGEFERILSEIYNYSQGVSYEEKDKKSKKKIECKSPSKRRMIPRFSTATLFPISSQSFNNNNNSNIIILNKIENKEINLPVDKIIENILIELPVPPRGIYKLEYSLNYQERKLHQNEMNQLPYVDINLKRIFVDFEIKQIIDIYRHLFLETRLLFFSEDIELLNIYIFSFLSFLYPFDYQYQIVTILPKENFEIMESITPFIAGINEYYEKDFFEKYNLTLSDGILVIDIDNRTTEMVNEQNTIPDFPKSYKKQLEKNLMNIVNTYLKEEMCKKKSGIHRNTVKRNNTIRENSIDVNSMMTQNLSFAETISPGNITDLFNFEDKDEITIDQYSNWNIDYNFNTDIGQTFFNFNAKLLSNYSKYLNLDFYSSNAAPSLELLFKVNEYLKEFSSSDKAFYNKFLTETQIFGDFIFMRMIPKNSKEKIQILSFDEKINENSAGYFSQPTPSVFSQSDEYKFNNNIVIQKPHELSMVEKGYYNQSKNKLELLLYGIMAKDSMDGKIIFNYPIFPKLLADIFFKQNFSQFIEPINLNENIKSINEDIILKSHLGGVKMRQNDMINYINLCWMQMWGMTFWYCDEKEKNYRFQELLKVINRTSNHEMEIFNLLFETLLENGTDYMILKLYDILIKLRLNPSLKVHNIAMKILDNSKGGGNINEKVIKSQNNVRMPYNQNNSFNPNNLNINNQWDNPQNHHLIIQKVLVYLFCKAGQHLATNTLILILGQQNGTRKQNRETFYLLLGLRPLDNSHPHMLPELCSFVHNPPLIRTGYPQRAGQQIHLL